jgi:nucleoside-diphosphate-sugar epimerase
MATTIFVAGASGVVGLRVVRLLHDAGFVVHGTTRSAGKSDALRRAGAIPVIVDVFDERALSEQMTLARPSIVMHQLTDLARPSEGVFAADAIAANARIRRDGTRSLIAAARAAGVERIIAQSIAWAYAEGPLPHTEADSLDTKAEGVRAISVSGVAALEDQVLGSPPLDGVVLRYGRFYGPDTGADRADDPAVHVDAAAHAALLATECVTSGIFNITDDNPVVANGKARRALGWNPSFRMPW